VNRAPFIKYGNMSNFHISYLLLAVVVVLVIVATSAAVLVVVNLVTLTEAVVAVCLYIIRLLHRHVNLVNTSEKLTL
jgi:hypothetical protein